VSNLHRQVRKSSFWILLRLAMSGCVGVFVTTAIIRSLSVEDYGVYALLFAALGYTGLFASFGIPQVFHRFIPEAFQRKDYTLVKQIVWRGLILRLVLSICVVLVMLVCSGPIGRLLGVEDWNRYFAVFALGMVAFLEVGLLSAALHGMFMHQYSVIGNIVWMLMRGVGVAVVLATRGGLVAVLWVEVLAWTCWLLVLCYFYYTRFARVHPVQQADTFPFKRFLRYSGFSFFNEVGTSILSVATDFIVLSIFLGPVAVGVYGFCDRIMRMFLHCLPHIVLRDVVRPAFFAKYTESGDAKQLEGMFNFLVKSGAFFLFPLAMGIWVLGDKLILYAFGAKYADAYLPLCVVVGFTAINSFAEPTGLVLQSLEKVNIQFYSKVFAIYNLVGDLLVAKPFGVLGVALVTSSAVLFKNLFCLHYSRRYSGIDIDWRGLAIICVNTLAVGILLLSFRRFIFGLWSLILSICVGVLFYLCLAVVNRSFTSDERSLVNRVLPRPVFVF
jgi:O-antigen/teichoic acid export membrane protein